LNKHPGKKKIEAASLSSWTVSDAKLRFTKEWLSFLLRNLKSEMKAPKIKSQTPSTKRQK